MPKKRTFYSEEERKAHHEKKQREADLQIQELTKHWENDPKDIAEYWCCTIKVDIGNSKGQYIGKDKQEATKDGSESTKIQHGI